MVGLPRVFELFSAVASSQVWRLTRLSPGVRPKACDGHSSRYARQRIGIRRATIANMASSAAETPHSSRGRYRPESADSRRATSCSELLVSWPVGFRSVVVRRWPAAWFVRTAISSSNDCKAVPQSHLFRGIIQRDIVFVCQHKERHQSVEVRLCEWFQLVVVALGASERDAGPV